MLLHTSALWLLLTLIGRCPADDIPVVSGVFMPNNITVNYEGAATACAAHYSRLATLSEVTAAFSKGYEYCKWGWVADHRLVMLRLTPFLPCANYNLGILIRDCPNVFSAFCASPGSVVVVPISGRVPSYENASITCLSVGSLATETQIQGNITTLPDGSVAWYSAGVGRVLSGGFTADVCYDTSSSASAFCYNPSLADVIIIKDDTTWKKIVMGCLLALIFIILLFAAAFMRGNKFVCCMGEKRTQPPQVTQSSMPTWNQTSIYRRISQANKGVLYDNLTNPEKRPPAIRPDMNLYKTHYTNMGFDASGEE